MRFSSRRVVLLSSVAGICLLGVGCAETSRPSSSTSAVQFALQQTELQVLLRDEAPWEDNHVKPRIVVRNEGSEPISDFRVHYYFTVDAGKTPILEDWHTPFSNPSIEALGGASGPYPFRVVYDYTGFTLAPGAVVPDDAGSVVGIHHGDWSSWNRADDWSYQGATDQFAPTDAVVVVVANGEVLHGSSPFDDPDPEPDPEPEPEPPPNGLNEQILSLKAPPAADFRSFALVSEGLLKLWDDAKLDGRALNMGASWPSWSWTYLGTEASSGDVFTKTKLILADGSTIDGDAHTGAHRSIAGDATITGDLFYGDFFPPHDYSLRVVTAGEAGEDVELSEAEGISLLPARYGTLSLAPESILRLTAGDYYFTAIEQLTPDSRIEVDDSEGAVRVFVATPFDVDAEIVSATGEENPNLLLGVLGPGTMTVASKLGGSLWAPRSTVFVEALPEDAAHEGTILAKDIKLAAEARFDFERSRALACLPRQTRIARPASCADTSLDVLSHRGVTAELWQGREVPETGKRVRPVESFEFTFSAPIDMEQLAAGVRIQSTECPSDVLPSSCVHDVALEFAFLTADRTTVALSNSGDPFLPGCEYKLTVSQAPIADEASCLGAEQNLTFRSLDPEADGRALHYEADSIRYDPRTRQVAGLKFKSDVAWDAESLFELRGADFALRAGLDRLESAGLPRVVRGVAYEYYRQTLRRVPVAGHGYTVTRLPSGADVRSLSGVVIAGLELDTNPAIPEFQARATALGELAGASTEPGQLFINGKSGSTSPDDFQLAWAYTLTSPGAAADQIVLVSAQTGDVLRSAPTVRTACASSNIGETSVMSPTGMETTLQLSTIQETNFVDPVDLVLDEYVDPSGTATFPLVHTKLIGSGLAVFSQCSPGLYPDVFMLPSGTPGTWDAEAQVVAQYQLAVEGALDHLATLPFAADGGNWIGWDGTGQNPIDIRSEDVAFSDASFNYSSQGTYLALDADEFTEGASLDIAGHELGHGVFRTLLDVRDPMDEAAFAAWETRSIDEGFSSILGAASEFFVRQDEPSLWCFGGDLTNNTQCLENFQDPHDAVSPTSYLGLYWLSEPSGEQCAPCNTECAPTDTTCLNACGGTVEACQELCGLTCAPHTNASILERWFYLVVKGEGGAIGEGCAIDVSPLADDLSTSLGLATQVLFTAVQSSFRAGEGYAELANHTIDVARSLEEAGALAPGSTDTVQNSWHKVGVWEGFSQDSDLIPVRDAEEQNPWITFRWELPEETELSDIQVTGSTFVSPDFERTVATTEEDGRYYGEASFPLDPKREYGWRVRPSLGDDNPWSDCHPAHYFVTGELPIIDGLLGLDPSSDLIPGTQKFRWNHIDGATQYRLLISSTRNPQCDDDADVDYEVTLERTFDDEIGDYVDIIADQVDVLQPNEHYWVNVLALGPETSDGTKAGGQCLTVEFDTGELPAPDLHFPKDEAVFEYYSPHGGQGDLGDLRWRWGGAGRPDHFEVNFYEVDEAGNCDSAPASPSPVTVPCDYCVSGELTDDVLPQPNPTGYCWDVVAVAANGVRSDPHEDMQRFYYDMPWLFMIEPGVSAGSSELNRSPGAIPEDSAEEPVAFSWETFPQVSNYGFKLGKWSLNDGQGGPPEPPECVSSSACTWYPEGAYRPDGYLSDNVLSLGPEIAGSGRYCYTAWPILDDPENPGSPHPRQPRVSPILFCYTTGPSTPVFDFPAPEEVPGEEQLVGEIRLDYVPDGQFTIEPNRSDIVLDFEDCEPETFVFLDYHDCVVKVSVDEVEPGANYEIRVRASNNPESMDEPGFDEETEVVNEVYSLTCGGEGQECCPNRTCGWASDDQPLVCGDDDTCSSCGNLTQQCCAGDLCTGCAPDDADCEPVDEAKACLDGTCVSCGEVGEDCCMGANGNPFCYPTGQIGPGFNACVDGKCEPCGEAPGQPCCTTDLCVWDNLNCDADEGECISCGGTGEGCCEHRDPSCDPGRTCDGGTCKPCGGLDELCCNGLCDDGLSCNQAWCGEAPAACDPPTFNFGVQSDSPPFPVGLPENSCSPDAEDGLSLASVDVPEGAVGFEFVAWEVVAGGAFIYNNEFPLCIPDALHGYSFWSICEDGSLSNQSTYYWHIDAAN